MCKFREEGSNFLYVSKLSNNLGGLGMGASRIFDWERQHIENEWDDGQKCGPISFKIFGVRGSMALRPPSASTLWFAAGLHSLATVS